jgi:hypothetical protein
MSKAAHHSARRFSSMIGINVAQSMPKPYGCIDFGAKTA